jgi:hypothetical protein
MNIGPPSVFDLLGRAENRLSRSAVFFCPPCHGFIAFRRAAVRWDRYESVPVVMMWSWSVT